MNYSPEILAKSSEDSGILEMKGALGALRVIDVLKGKTPCFF